MQCPVEFQNLEKLFLSEEATSDPYIENYSIIVKSKYNLIY